LLAHSLSDQSAQQILAYLKSPNPEQFAKLSQEKINFLLALDSTKASSFESDLKNNDKDSLNAYTPIRAHRNKDVDLQILEQFYQNAQTEVPMFFN